MLTEEEIRQAFEKAKEWIKKNLPELAMFVDEPSLEFIDNRDGWDIRPFIAERKIRINMFRVQWHLEREQEIKYCPKYDIETALIHDLYEYCYFRKWDYPEDDQVILGLTHSRARKLENMLRRERGMSDWV